jgi:hypothetical protein
MVTLQSGRRGQTAHCRVETANRLKMEQENATEAVLILNHNIVD